MREALPPWNGLRRATAAPRPELSAAFAAIGGEAIAARLLILPSADSRRVLEEMVPNFPAELGGGPMTDLTRGMLWAALGLEIGPQPSLRLVAESKDASAAKALERLAHNVVEYLGRLPDLRDALARIAQDPRRHQAQRRRYSDYDECRRQAGCFSDRLRLAPGHGRPRSEANASTMKNRSAWPFTTTSRATTRSRRLIQPDKAGKPLLSWRVLILPYIEQDALVQGVPPRRGVG